MKEIHFKATFEIKGLTDVHEEELKIIVMDDWSDRDIENMKFNTAHDWIMNNINIHIGN